MAIVRESLRSFSLRAVAASSVRPSKRVACLASSTVAEMAIRSLMDRGVLAVLISFRDGEVGNHKEGLDKSQPFGSYSTNDKKARWAWRERDTPDCLPMEETFDGTLAKIGTRTRRNMRYYRKRAEAGLVVDELMMFAVEAELAMAKLKHAGGAAGDGGDVIGIDMIGPGVVGHTRGDRTHVAEQ